MHSTQPVATGVPRTVVCVSVLLGIPLRLAKTDKPIRMLGIRVRPVNRLLAAGAYWRHLVITIKRSVRCGGDAALCQNTLTTC